jgi:ribosomal 30S subunit maturation factor RimM
MNIRHIAAAAVFVSLLGAPSMVSAQQRDLPTAVETASPPSDKPPAGYVELGDMNVVNPAGEKIGEVEEVLMDTSGKVVAVAVEVGGFLGIGDDDVIIPLDQLRLENNQLMTALTKEQIEVLPKWED